MIKISKRWGYAGRWLITKGEDSQHWFVYAPGTIRACKKFPTFEAARAAFAAGATP